MPDVAGRVVRCEERARAFALRAETGIAETEERDDWDGNSFTSAGMNTPLSLREKVQPGALFGGALGSGPPRAWLRETPSDWFAGFGKRACGGSPPANSTRYIRRDPEKMNLLIMTDFRAAGRISLASAQFLP
jgi:hypothetical protein